MTFAEWQQLTAADAALEIRKRIEASLDPAQRRAVVATLPDPATLERAFDQAPKGPLRAIPYFLKDLFDVAGLPTFAGSSFLPEVRPTPAASSRIVCSLEDAGAVMAGKVHLFEFAWGLTGENAHYGSCDRPGYPGRTAGGSSSGSAAAVAAGIVPLAIGTDTGGSIRVPAAFCGVFGYRGAPRSPLIDDAFPLSPSFDTAGWFTRTAADMRTATAALAGLKKSEREPKGGYLEMPGLDADVALACRNASAVLAPALDSATRDELLHVFAPAAEVYGVLAGVEAWKVHKKWADRHRERYGPLLRDRLDRARAISPAQVAAVKSSKESIDAAWDSFFRAHDFLVMAAAPFPAPENSNLTAANRLRGLELTSPVSLGGLPALTIPVPLPSGLTAGLQVVFKDPQSPVIPWVLGMFA